MDLAAEFPEVRIDHVFNRQESYQNYYNKNRQLACTPEYAVEVLMLSMSVQSITRDLVNLFTDPGSGQAFGIRIESFIDI